MSRVVELDQAKELPNYRPKRLARHNRELCHAIGCKSLERVIRGRFCKKHRAEYQVMMSKPPSLRPLFSTWV